MAAKRKRNEKSAVSAAPVHKQTQAPLPRRLTRLSASKISDRPRSLEREMPSRQSTVSESDSDFESDSEDDDAASRGDASSQHAPQGTESPQPRKKKRGQTPEGAEDVTIVPTMVTMFELAARSRQTGRTSEREKRMRQIDWTAVNARRKADEQKLAWSKRMRSTLTQDSREPVNDANDAGNEDIDTLIANAAEKNRRNQQELQIRHVGGEHRFDPASQKVDRHALANEDLDTLEEIEEDDLTKRFNSHSYVHLKRRDPAERIPSKDKWTDEDTVKFYEGLSLFGTDFLIISRMFPGRSRRHVKAKFVREERANPERVRRALIGEGRQSWDIQAYQRVAGVESGELLDPAELTAELDRLGRERRLEIEAERKRTLETRRQKHMAGHYSDEESEA